MDGIIIHTYVVYAYLTPWTTDARVVVQEEEAWKFNGETRYMHMLIDSAKVNLMRFENLVVVCLLCIREMYVCGMYFMCRILNVSCIVHFVCVT